MSVQRYETADGTRWRVRWRDEGGRMHSKSVASKRDAEALNTDIKAKKLRAELLPQPRRWTLADAWQEWDRLHVSTLAPSTQLVYRTLWRAHVEQPTTAGGLRFDSYRLDGMGRCRCRRGE